MPSTLTLLHACDYRRERWRNQQGWTREILRVPDQDAFHWRISIAEISQDTLFSPYLGYRRAQVLLQGQGMHLGFIDGRRLQLDMPHGQAQFDGNDVAACHLPDGPVQVFNAIWDPQHVQLQLLRRPLVGTVVFPHIEGVQWFVHLLAGQARFQDPHALELNAGDSLVLRSAAGERIAMDGQGEALLLRIVEASAPTSPESPIQLTPPTSDAPHA
ncbi:MAG: HutD family protein [Xanthomonadales bacterium]|nr:HutD family protein [Xanthomonadales bacterium]